MLFLILLSFSIANAQALASKNIEPITDQGNRQEESLAAGPKWSSSFYHGFSTGFSFFNGGSAMFFSMPVGWQLNRRITDNVFAFAGVSVAPTYANFNHSYFYASQGKTGLYGDPGANNFGMNARAELGLMYVNDARTFSISGSFGVQRGTNPLLINQPGPVTRTNNGFPQNR
jgi:hypothetical protein